MEVKRSNHGTNVRRWREWRGVKQEILADMIGVSQATLSGYEKKERLEEEVLVKISKALEIPVEAITELGNDAGVNIYANTFQDIQSTANGSGLFLNNNYPTFNPIDKMAELYERLLKSEQEKVTSLVELLQETNASIQKLLKEKE